jgi:hypothetical protein
VAKEEAELEILNATPLVAVEDQGETVYRKRFDDMKERVKSLSFFKRIRQMRREVPMTRAKLSRSHACAPISSCSHHLVLCVCRPR